jgi:hypothetical protein
VDGVAVGKRGAVFAADLQAFVFEDREHEAALAGEVAVDQPLGAARTLGDFAGRRAVITALGEDSVSGLDEGDAALLFVLWCERRVCHRSVVCVRAHLRSR